MTFAMEKWHQTAFFCIINIEMQGREHTACTYACEDGFVWRRIEMVTKKFPTLFSLLSVNFVL